MLAIYMPLFLVVLECAQHFLLFNASWFLFFWSASRNCSVAFQNEKLNKNTALSEEILMLFCQGNLHVS